MSNEQKFCCTLCILLVISALGLQIASNAAADKNETEAQNLHNWANIVALTALACCGIGCCYKE